MIYSSFQFIAVLPVVLVVFYLLPTAQLQNTLLLIACLAFLGSFGIFHVEVAAAVVGFAYIGLLIIRKVSSGSVRSAVVFLLLLNLFLFKLLPFQSGNLTSDPTVIGDHWPIPIGLSYYTFQIIGGLFELSLIKKTPNFLSFFNFITFFPHMIAGPICQARTLLPQFTAKRFDVRNLKLGFWLFSVGYLKKVLIADPIADVIDPIWQSPLNYGSSDLLFATLGFYVQIFADFSGYTDMGRGIARAFGYRLPINFRAPYLAHSPLDFWQRWHVSITQWFRRYYFMPLAVLVSRHTSPKRRKLWLAVCVFIVLCSIGIWHGIAWNYLLFGATHACFVMIWQFVTNGKPPKSTLTMLTSWGLFQFFNALTLVFFRAPTIGDVVIVLRGMTLGAPASWFVERDLIIYATVIIFTCQIVEYFSTGRRVATVLIQCRTSPRILCLVFVAFLATFLYKTIETDGRFLGNPQQNKIERFIYMSF